MQFQLKGGAKVNHQEGVINIKALNVNVLYFLPVLGEGENIKANYFGKTKKQVSVAKD
jgi:hypothetical protein